MSKMTRLFGGAIFATVLLLGASAAPVQAASLTQTQINAILALLSAFGADSATIANVNTALNGGTPTTGNTKTWCHTFSTDLKIGDRGGNIGNEVLDLQEVLDKEGFSDVQQEWMGSDNSAVGFGEKTAAAVVQFQAQYGIQQTGYVGPMTRAKLNSLYGCSITNPPTPTTKINGSCGAARYSCYSGNSTLTTENANAYSWFCFGLNGGGTASCAQGKSATTPVGDLVIQDLTWTPNSPTVSSTDPYIYVTATIKNNGTGSVTLPSGTKFTLTKNGVLNGEVAIGNPPRTLAQGETWSLAFTSTQSPNLRAEAGTFTLVLAADSTNVVSEINEGNNTISKTIIIVSPTPTLTVVNPVISGVSGSTSLQVGQSGRWTINASDSSNGMLGYSVVWGDENNVGMAASATATTQQTTSFYHDYSRAGTYNPTFTVINSYGGSTKTSMSVVVK